MSRTGKTLYKILRKMHIHREEMELNANFHTDFFFDKLDMEILLFYLETDFNISIDNKDIDKLSTIYSTYEFLETKGISTELNKS